MDIEFKIGEKICIKRDYVRELAKLKGENADSWVAFIVENFTGIVTGYNPGSVIVQNKNGAEVEIGEGFVEHFIDLKEMAAAELKVSSIANRAVASGIKKLHVNPNIIVPSDTKPKLKLHHNERSDR